jgi:hypothetical protein
MMYRQFLAERTPLIVFLSVVVVVVVVVDISRLLLGDVEIAVMLRMPSYPFDTKQILIEILKCFLLKENYIL